MFNASTVAQMAVFFANAEATSTSGGAKIHTLKLMKLMYLADRESMGRCGHPISFDDMVSMKHGPVLSRTLDLINGFVDGEQGKMWDHWISGRADHAVASRRQKIVRDDLDRISDADLSVLNSVWKKFGKMNEWALCDYTHQHCPEWRDPTDQPVNVIPIDETEIFVSFGVDRREAKKLAKEIRAVKSLEQHFSSA